MPKTDHIREFVIAAHGNLNKVREMFEKYPNLVNASYAWSESDRESAIQAAAQVGSVSVAEFLLTNGAPLEICTAAMLGRAEDVKSRLDDDPRNADAVGAHGIPLLPHAVWSADPALIQLVYDRGARKGANLALHNAVINGNPEIVEWLLDKANPDVTAKNFQGKTPLTVAKERNMSKIVELLKEHGATD